MAKEIFDLQKVAYLKRKFNLDLVPIMEMLTHSKSVMKGNEWMDLIERTRLSVTAHPNQYLHGDLPEKSILEQVVYSIFDEYLKSESAPLEP